MFITVKSTSADIIIFLSIYTFPVVPCTVSTLQMLGFLGHKCDQIDEILFGDEPVIVLVVILLALPSVYDEDLDSSSL